MSSGRATRSGFWLPACLSVRLTALIFLPSFPSALIYLVHTEKKYGGTKTAYEALMKQTKMGDKIIRVIKGLVFLMR